MSDYTTHTIRIRTGCAHAVLSSTHFRRSNHFHGAGDLTRALDTRNLGFNLFSDCHITLPLSSFRFTQRGNRGAEAPAFLPGLGALELLDTGFKLGSDLVVISTASINLFNQVSVLRSKVGQQRGFER